MTRADTSANDNTPVDFGNVPEQMDPPPKTPTKFPWAEGQPSGTNKFSNQFL